MEEGEFLEYHPYGNKITCFKCKKFSHGHCLEFNNMYVSDITIAAECKAYTGTRHKAPQNRHRGNKKKGQQTNKKKVSK